MDRQWLFAVSLTTNSSHTHFPTNTQTPLVKAQNNCTWLYMESNVSGALWIPWTLCNGTESHKNTHTTTAQWPTKQPSEQAAPRWRTDMQSQNVISCLPMTKTIQHAPLSSTHSWFHVAMHDHPVPIKWNQRIDAATLSAKSALLSWPSFCPSWAHSLTQLSDSILNSFTTWVRCVCYGRNWVASW